MARSEPLLSVRDIHTFHGYSYVLQGVSLEVGAGQVVAILGRNGMGKTTLIRSIAGLTPPRRGEVRYRGEPLAGLSPHAIAQRGIALVPQGRRIFRSLTVRENLELPTSRLAGRARRRESAARRWDLARVLAEFPQLGARSGHLGG
ncbi:MAG: ATP-binding cassette domain-containing protein, partial [Geminicoccaceae bacterium]